MPRSIEPIWAASSDRLKIHRSTCWTAWLIRWILGWLSFSGSQNPARNRRSPYEAAAALGALERRLEAAGALTLAPGDGSDLRRSKAVPEGVVTSDSITWRTTR